MAEEKKTSTGRTLALGALPLVVVAGIAAVAVSWHHVHGATPQQLMDEPLSRTPKQLARDLPSTELRGTTVRVDFRHGTAGPYERADFEWSSRATDAPYEMHLRPERHESNASAAEALAGLRRHFHALENGEHKWGSVSVGVEEDGDVSFSIDRTLNRKPNPLFDRQIEAAKEVVLNAAFDLPLKVSAREVADVLGSGYALSEVAQLDLSVPVESAAKTVTAKFPATLVSRSSEVEIPLDHPLMTKLQIAWNNQPSGSVRTLALYANEAYANSRQTLEACLEKKVGPPVVTVTDYAAGRKNYTFTFGAAALSLELEDTVFDVTIVSNPLDRAAFAAMLQALDGCRDVAERGTHTR